MRQSSPRVEKETGEDMLTKYQQEIIDRLKSGETIHALKTLERDRFFDASLHQDGRKTGQIRNIRTFQVLLAQGWLQEISCCDMAYDYKLNPFKEAEAFAKRFLKNHGKNCMMEYFQPPTLFDDMAIIGRFALTGEQY